MTPLLLTKIVFWSGCIVGLAFMPEPRPTREDAWAVSDRRGFFAGVAALSGCAPLLYLPSTAGAKGLVQFPLSKPLFNSYSFMRVGTTLLEEEDIWSTNPLFLTNRDDALSAEGQAQVQRASRNAWNSENASKSSPTIIIHSLAASAIDTANILQQSLQLGRDRIRPEFTLLDPRGIGMFDSLTRSTTEPAVWALDADRGGRPPPNEDGTPNESLEDQAVRLRQLLSYLETQYSGESILLVFPDGTGPALLGCLMAGIPLSEVHRLEFGPAEIRLNVTPTLIKAWYQDTATKDEAYQQVLARGRVTLTDLQSRKEWINRKDEKLEAERLAYEESQRKKAAQQAVAEERAEKQRKARAEAIASSSAPSSHSASLFPGLASGVVVASVGLTQLYKEENIDDLSNQTISDSPTGNDSGETMIMDTDATVQTTLSTNGTHSTSTDTLTSKQSPQYEGTWSRVNGDSMAVMEKTRDEKKSLADQAMLDYMAQDDGGEAWLSSIADILEEEGESDWNDNVEKQ